MSFKNPLSLLFIFFISRFLAQTNTTDSLLIEFKKAKHDTTRCLILAEITLQEGDDNIWPYYNQQLKKTAEKNLTNKNLSNREKKQFKQYLSTAYSNEAYISGVKGDVAKNIDYLQKAIDIAREIGDTEGMIIYLNNIATVYHSTGNIVQAIANFKECLKLAEKTGDNDQQGILLNNLAVNYNELGEISKALDYAYKALKIHEADHDDLQIGISIYTIANFYTNRKEYDKALEFLFKSLELFKKKNVTLKIAENLHNIGVVYDKQNNKTKAIEYLTKSLKINESINYQKGIASCYNDMGAIYFENGDLALAGQNFTKSLEIQEKIGDKKGMASSLKDLSVLYFKENKIKEALKYAEQSLAIAKETGNPYSIENATEIIMPIYKKQGNYKKALEMHELYIQVKDSINNDNIRKNSLNKEFQYKFDKKEAEVMTKAKIEKEKIELKAAEDAKRQNLIIYSVITGLLLVSVFSVFIYRGLQENKKANKIITQQKHLVEEKNHLIEEKQKEIIDSINYAQRIQRSLLASKELLDQNLKEYFVLFKPKDIVSGDFYWASKLSNGNFAIVTADSTGHGVPGAIMSMLNIACLNEAISNGFTAPNDILFETRLKIIEHLKNDGSESGGKDGMDCSLLCIDNSNKILYAAAANNPVWIIRNSTSLNTSEIIEIKPDKMPVGKHDRDTEPFTLHTIALQKGDTIYTLTDGFPDQFGGEKGKKFMSKNLKEFLKTIVHLPLSEQKATLESSFTKWVGDLEQIDDVSIIGIRI